MICSSAVAVLSATCLAGCGAGGPSHPNAPGASAPRPEHASRQTARPPGFAARLLARAEAALGHVHSFHAQVTTGPPGGVISHADMDVALPGRMSITTRSAGARFTLRLIGSEAFHTGNRRYWMSVGVPSDRAGMLAGRWVRVPLTSVPAVVRDLISPKLMGRCMLALTGSTVTLHRMPQNKWYGKLVLQQRARPPSRTTAFVFMADHAPWLPRGAVQDGPDNPPDRTCGETAATEGSGGTAARFSRYNAPIRITAPPHAMSLQAARRITTTRALAPNAADGAERRQAAQLNGDWVVRGTVTASHNFQTGPRVGETANRVWEFASRCRLGVCGLMMVRHTNKSPLIAGLAWHRGLWRASFANTFVCADGSVHPETDEMTIWLNGRELIATEHVKTGRVCGQSAALTTLWRGRQILPVPGSRPAA